MADFIPSVVLASDTVDAQSGTFSRIADAATKGLGSAAISGALSIYNTALDYAGKEAIDTGEVIRNFDSSWGDYYEQNKEAIDFAGFVGTSFVPGALGIKALKLARSGQALGPVSRALGLTSSKQSQYLSQAITELGRSGGTVTAAVSSAKNAQLGWALADNVLTSAAAEAAILLTMNDSPIFENQTAGDFASNVITGAAFGGVVGGLLSAGAARGVLKQAQYKIENFRRDFDTVFDPAKLGLFKSDEILKMADDILKLPDDFYSTNFNYTYDGKKFTTVIDTAAAFKDIKRKTEKTGFDILANKFNELAEGGEITGQAMFEFIRSTVEKGRAGGRSALDISDEIQGYLLNVKRIAPLEVDAGAIPPPKQFFINLEPKGLNDLFSETKGIKTGKQAYYLKNGDISEIKFGSVARLGLDSADDAFELGYDAVFTKAGKVSINPKSKLILSTPDQALKSKFYLDLESGSLTSEAVVTGADLMKHRSDFKLVKNTVYIGKQELKQADSLGASLDQTPLQASARFMWASTLEDREFKKRVIEWNDFALLDRMKQLPQEMLNSDNIQIKLGDGRLIPMSDIVDAGSYVNQLKLEWLQQTLGKAEKGTDLRILSNATNTTQKWLEDAIASNFAQSTDLLKEARPLNSYFQPKTVELQWDDKLKQVIGGFDPTGPNQRTSAILAQEYRLATQLRQSNNAFRSVLGEDAERFQTAEEGLSRYVSERGAGASVFGSSNADYGRRAEQFVQETGKQVSLVSQKWRDAAITQLAPVINAIRDNKEAAAELGILTTALRRDSRKYYLVVGSSGQTWKLVDREAVKLVEAGTFDNYYDAIQSIQQSAKSGEKVRGSYDIKSAVVGEFLQANQAQNAQRIQKQTVLLNASGIARELDDRAIYVPPVDTKRYPYFAFVVSKERIGSKTEVSMITARNEEQLRTLAAKVGEDHEVIFKNDTKRFFEAKGKYEYDSQINESSVNSTLEKRGILGDFFPETRAENVLEDYVRWNSNSVDNLIRTAVQVNNRQFFSEVGFLSEQFQASATSAVKSLGVLRKNVQDPFADYIKTALNISKQSEYPILESLNEFVDRVGTQAYKKLDDLWTAFRGTQGKDLTTLQKANELLDSYGLGTPYKTMEEYLVANEKVPRNLIKTAFQKANFWLATVSLRFDFANSLVNIISTPIMLGTELSSIKTLIGKDSELAGKLAMLTNVKVPGQEAAVPGTTKLIGQAIHNYFGPEKQVLLRRYKDNGDIKDISMLYHEVLDDLAYRPGRPPGEWSEKVDAAVEKGSKITGNTFSEELTRFVSADVMRQLSQPLVDAGKMTIKEQNSYISSFVNRVQGNYISSQRPIVFQGTTGAAVGLFQTYAFNLLQQLFRHVENADRRTLLTFGGLQSSIYGMNGLPFFDAINTHLIGSASGNREHKDAYSLLPSINHEVGNWLLYGTASAFPLFGEKVPSLYSRGDINPRHLSILPINPLDIPAVSASLKLVDSVRSFGKNVAAGADLSNSFLQALEHQGWNRPLAGFAQVLAGQTTTGRGSLISAANDLETTSMLARIPARMVDFGGVARVMGSRPMDEAVALNNLYRNKAYEAMDRSKIEALGQAVKTKLANNQLPDDEELEDFMDKYTRAGGRIETFSSHMQRWMKDSNQSIVNQMAQKVSSPYGKKMQMVMGGEPLQDYTTISADQLQQESSQ